MMAKLSIIIVNWNAGDVLRECIEAIYRTVSGQFEIIVVDNNSSDGSGSVLEKAFPEIALIKETQNLGYARANNIGVRRSRGEHILILNPDVIVTADAINKMVNFLETHSAIGIIGPKILDENNNISMDTKSKSPSLLQDFIYLFLIKKALNWVSIKLSGLAFAKKIVYNYYNKPGECEFLSGCCLLLRKELYEILNGFDESLPMYLDDIDLCYRCRKSGKKNFYIAYAEIVHIGQYSTKKAPDYKSYDILNLKARLYYYRKHFNVHKVMAYKLIVVLSIPYLLLLDILSFPYFLLSKKLCEKASVVRKHLRYIDVIMEK